MQEGVCLVYLLKILSVFQSALQYLFARWNGAIDVQAWALTTGDNADSLSVGERVDKDGFVLQVTLHRFETSLSLESASASEYVAVGAFEWRWRLLGLVCCMLGGRRGSH